MQNVKTRPPHQSTTTEEDHEDDEGLEPVVLHDQVAGFPQEPPVLPPAHGDVNFAAFIFGHAGCKHKGEERGKKRESRNIKCKVLSCVLISA